jgi:hypothetical protein
MEGRREEYLANRPLKPIAHMADVEEVVKLEEDPEPTLETVLSDDFAAMSLGTPNTTSFSSYSLSSLSSLPDDDSFAFISLSQHYNSALDSACTNHIIRDRHLFHTYDTSGALPVKTANCGFLETLAVGDVKFRINVNGTDVIWTLRNCLHAPTVSVCRSGPMDRKKTGTGPNCD